MATSVQIAPSTEGMFETRVIGPGGWRTAYLGDLSQAKHEAWAWSVVLSCEIEDLSPSALITRAEYDAAVRGAL